MAEHTGLVAVAVFVGRVNFGRSQRQRAIRSGAAKRQYGMGEMGRSVRARQVGAGRRSIAPSRRKGTKGKTGGWVGSVQRVPVTVMA